MLTIKRRYTANLKLDLPGIVSELIEPLTLEREVQAKEFIAYKQTMITDQAADRAKLRLYREGVPNIQRVARCWSNESVPRDPFRHERDQFKGT